MQNKSAEAQFEVLWPLAQKAERPQSAASRLPDLSGKTVGELWDSLFRGDVVYPLIRERLRARYPGIKFVDYSVFGNFFGARSKDIVGGLADKIRAHGCDALIVGIGA